MSIAKVDIPMPDLQSQNPEIDRFSASFIILCQDPVDPPDPKALLIQRGYDGSWAESWEGPGGGYDSKDASIKDTALRETEEESGVIVRPENIFPLVYRKEVEHNGDRMAYYTFIALIAAIPLVKLSQEHLDSGLFGEEEVRNFGPFDEAKSSQVEHVMLESKKQTLLHIFENLEMEKKGDENGPLQMKISC